MCQRHSNLNWCEYVAGDIVNREDYEEALAVCAECLNEYMVAVAADLEEPSAGFVDVVMAGVLTSGPAKPKQNKMLIHYLVAACLTLVLLRLGAFEWLSSLTLNPEPGFLMKIYEGLSGAVKGLISNIGGI